MKLKRDIYSTFNPGHKYASAGDEIVIISPIIVKGPDGDPFTINPDDILQEGEKMVKEERSLNKVPAKKQSKSNSTTTKTLF